MSDTKSADGMVKKAGTVGSSLNTPTPSPSVAPAEDPNRPWHGNENPFEALYQHIKDEIAALEARLSKKPAATPTPTPVPTPTYVAPPVSPVPTPSPTPQPTYHPPSDDPSPVVA